METLSATTIFWLIALGSITGWLTGYLMGKEGMSKYSNALWGVFGSLSVGLVALLVGVSSALLYAFIGTLATLFIANVFHSHHQEDIYGGEDHGITVRRYHKKANHQ
ncbi:MAG TPA: hypothetical protein VJ964_14000 [Balneolaceae bacterium]|nr:hypothetical protein [Balneolaceae bacterium]